MASPEDVMDLTIIGAGPAGLFGAFYAGLRGLTTRIVDVQSELGGQLTALYPEKYVYDVAGCPKVLAKDLAKNLAIQAQLFQPALCLSEKVTDLQKVDDTTWKVVTNKPAEHRSRAVLITVGAGACIPKKLNVTYPPAFDDVHVFYGVKSKDTFKDKKVLVIGGGDSAVDWANELSHVAAHVTLIHRRDKFLAVQSSVDALKTNGVEVKTFFELKQVNGTSKLDDVILVDNRTHQEETVQVDVIVINIGYQINLDYLKSWGLTLDKNAIVVNEKMETNLSGIYAAGDICTHTGKLKLIATGVAEAAIAVNFAVTYINPSAKASPGHSSNLDLKV